MGKWVNYKVLKQHIEDLSYVRDELKDIYPHVVNVAKTFPRDSIAIGTLDLNDLIQAGHEGLWRAWQKVDWDKLKDSPNPTGELWSFLKKRIRWSIRREIDKYGQHIATPINKLENTRNKLGNQYLDRVLVNIFPKFFDGEVVPLWNNESPWISIQLEELINEALDEYVSIADHRTIICKFYGVGYDKMSTKELAEEYKKDPKAISQIVHTVKQKLKNQDFEKIIENFWENYI